MRPHDIVSVIHPKHGRVGVLVCDVPHFLASGARWPAVSYQRYSDGHDCFTVRSEEGSNEATATCGEEEFRVYLPYLNVDLNNGRIKVLA